MKNSFEEQVKSCQEIQRLLALKTLTDEQFRILEVAQMGIAYSKKVWEYAKRQQWHRAYSEGWSAGKSSVPLDDCPYREGTNEYEAWLEGF